MPKRAIVEIILSTRLTLNGCQGPTSAHLVLFQEEEESSSMPVLSLSVYLSRVPVRTNGRAGAANAQSAFLYKRGWKKSV